MLELILVSVALSNYIVWYKGTYFYYPGQKTTQSQTYPQHYNYLLVLIYTPGPSCLKVE